LREAGCQLRPWTVFIGVDGGLQRTAQAARGDQRDPVQAAEGDGLEASDA
jgi:hypothetical protein